MFDKKEFVESVIARKLDLDEIVSEARVDILLVESHVIRPVGSSDYAEFLRILVFFLISEVKAKPANLSDDDFQLLHRLTQHLVDHDGLNPDVLELFGG